MDTYESLIQPHFLICWLFRWRVLALRTHRPLFQYFNPPRPQVRHHYLQYLQLSRQLYHLQTQPLFPALRGLPVWHHLLPRPFFQALSLSAGRHLLLRRLFLPVSGPPAGRQLPGRHLLLRRLFIPAPNHPRAWRHHLS